MRRSRSQVALRLTLACLAVMHGLAALGCDGGEPAELVGDPIQPAPRDLSAPELAVRSCLDWVSLSYRMANSDIPTATMTPEEGVRVDSYIQLNRIDGKGIEQTLEAFDVVSVSEEAWSAVVTARESWRYRCFSLETLEYVSEMHTASYDTTYTLVPGEGGWVVDAVEATAEGEVQ